MDFDEITYKTGEGVAHIVLNRPEQLNAISNRPSGTRDQIVVALELAEADDEVGCVLLSGAGRAFSSGGDLTGNPRRDSPEADLAFLTSVDSFNQRVRSSAVPVVAAVHGHCLGAGLSLAASCDLMIAAEGALFGYPEARLGMVGASAIVPSVGRKWAKFLMMTGELLTAQQACAIGLVLVVVPDNQVLDRARDLATRIARMPRESILLNRRTIDAVADASGDAAGWSAALEHDAAATSRAAHATAPDGRTFRDIIETEGIPGLKAARQAQYSEPWLEK